MGLPPAHVKTMNVVAELKLRRRLSQIFCGPMEQDRKKWDSFRRLFNSCIPVQNNAIV